MNLSAFAQDRHDWQQATARLHAGDNLHISLKTGPVEAAFVSATPQELSVAGDAFKKEDILKIERVQTKGGGASSRTKIYSDRGGDRWRCGSRFWSSGWQLQAKCVVLCFAR